MRRGFVALLTALLLLMAACGGSSSEGESDEAPSDGESAQTTVTQPVADADDDEPEPTTTTAAAGGDAGSSDGDEEGSATGASVGTLTVAGETYFFADTGFPGLQCMPAAFNVGFLSALQQVDENGGALQGNLTVNVPFKGEEETAGILPAVRGNVGDLEWIADIEHAELNSIPAGSGQVDSYEIDGNTITGTATFYEENSSFGQGDLIVEQGTFEVTCVES